MGKITMRKTNGVYEATRVVEREYRKISSVEGLLLEGSLGVSRGGAFKLLDANEQYVTSQTFDFWPHAFFTTKSGIVRADVRLAVAQAWLTAAQRNEIREQFPAKITPKDYDRVAELGETYNVSKHAIVRVLSTVEGQSRVLSLIDYEFKKGDELFEMENPEIESYSTSLSEYASPVPDGHNPTALHLHTLKISGQYYDFFARGYERLFTKDDDVSFQYSINSEGFHEIQKHTICVTDDMGVRHFPGDVRREPEPAAQMAMLR